MVSRLSGRVLVLNVNEVREMNAFRNELVYGTGVGTMREGDVWLLAH